MAQYNYKKDFIYAPKENFNPLFKIIKKYNLAKINNDYVHFYKLTFKFPYTLKTRNSEYKYNENDSILYIKKKEDKDPQFDYPLDILKIFGFYSDIVFEDYELKEIQKDRITFYDFMDDLISNCEVSEITPPEEKTIIRAFNENYKKDLINILAQISFNYAKQQSFDAFANQSVVKDMLANPIAIKEYEENLKKIKVHHEDKLQIEIDTSIRKKIKKLKQYYETDNKVLEELNAIANRARHEGILNEIIITQKELNDNNIKIYPDAVNSLDSYITQTEELLKLYKEKYDNIKADLIKKEESKKELNSEDIDLYNNLPVELRNLNQYIIWKEINNKKIPINAFTGWFGSTNDEMCWCDLETALKAKEKYNCNGIGIVLSKGLMGIDINDMYDENNSLIPIANSLIKELNSYTEYSKSKKGCHILFYGKQPSERSKFGKNIRWYSNDHFFDLTAIKFEITNEKLTSEEDAQPIINKYYSLFMSDNQNKFNTFSPDEKWQFSITNLQPKYSLKTENLTTNKNEKNEFGFDDDEIIIELRMKIDDFDLYFPKNSDLKRYQELLNSDKLDEFRLLWKQKNNLWTNKYQNEADSWNLAVCDFIQSIRLYTNDRNQIDRIFRNSYLMSVKFDELKGESTYGQELIKQILMRFNSPYNDRK